MLRTSAQSRVDWQSRYIRWLRISDTVVVVLAVVVAQRIRFGEYGSRLEYRDIDYTMVSLVIIAVWLIALAIYRSRSARVIGAGVEEYRRVSTATLSGFGAIAILSMVFRLDLARGYLAIALPLGLAGLFVSRRYWRAKVAKRRMGGEFLASVLVVGERRSATSLIQSLARQPEYGYAVAGLCIPGEMDRTSIAVPGVGEFPVFGNETDIAQIIGDTGIDTVAVAATEHLGPQGIRDLSWTLEKLDVDLMVSPGVSDVANPRLVMQPIAGLPLIHLEKPQYNGAKRFEKRLFDLCFAALVLLVVSPLMLLAAIAIKLSSRGPVFYRSERIGIDGTPFQMIKFRTMVDGADQRAAELMNLNEADGGVLFKIRDDPRVTGIGRYLRKYSIDELPQFINVLRREMSVVGPRPPLAREVAAYDSEVRRRLLVLPGITGLWQVSGRSDLSWEESVRLDLSYVENWSMVGDLMIVFRTIKAVMRGSGAY